MTPGRFWQARRDTCVCPLAHHGDSSHTRRTRGVMMFEKLEEVVERFERVSNQLADPEIISDRNAYTRLAKEHADLSNMVAAYSQWKSLHEELADAKEMLRDSDPDTRELAKEEVPSLEKQIEKISNTIKRLLLPKDPLDGKNIILEIRAGTGGDEASLFVGDLLNMYERYASSRRWSMEILSGSSGTMGGYKEVIALISGKSVYSRLKFEAGVHRVQRVPTTESQGRIHTSACTVAILPEAEEVDVKIEDKDLKIDTYRSSGAGGQHVNVTDSAVRITHLPTNVVVTSQDERSQHKNKARAMKVLRSKLFEHERMRQQSVEADARRSQVGSGDRSERIRTYNFPQNRLTDHRIGLTLYSLDRIISSGEIDEIVDALLAYNQAEQLKDAGLV